MRDTEQYGRARPINRLPRSHTALDCNQGIVFPSHSLVFMLVDSAVGQANRNCSTPIVLR